VNARPQASPPRTHPWVAYAAAGWALIFGVFHIVWAAGWYIGLDPVAARANFAVPWKLAYDLVAGGMCFVAVPVSLALGMPWGRRVPRRLLGFLAWTGTGLLVLRAGGGLLQGVYELVSGRFDIRRVGIWEPWFYLGAALFGLNLWRSRRRTVNDQLTHRADRTGISREGSHR
jgi:hypothetical protein